MDMLGIGLELLSIMITFVILFGVILGKKNTMNEYFPTMLLLNALTLICDMATLTFGGNKDYLLLIKICWILQFSFAFMQIDCFNLYVDTMIARVVGSKKIFRIFPFILTAAMIVVWIMSVEMGFLFKIDKTGLVEYGKYFWVAQLAGCVIVFIAVTRVIVVQLQEKLEGKTALGIYLFVGLPLLSLPLEEFIGNQSLLLAATTVSYLIMYISIHVRSESAELEKKAEMEKIQTELIMSQIQPHFIFNSLTTIKYLCADNSALAMEALTKFTKYLRRNLDAVTDEGPAIEFREELEHTKCYLWMEQLRFGDTLKVEYSVDVEDFMIPRLSLQPIVENAVKHGITKKVGGGTVAIRVRDNIDYIKIIVEDDGVGFDTGENIVDREKYHGINDVRKRLMEFHGSRLTVNSHVGDGTKAIYEIMKGDQDE